MQITIKLRDQVSGENIILADGILNENVVEGDDGYYFDPKAVNKDVLVKRAEIVTGEVGSYQFLDAIEPQTGNVLRTEVGWLVEEAAFGLEELLGAYGFPAISEEGVIVEIDGHSEEPLEDTDTIVHDLYQ